ncbi:PREDICTED: high-affinity choline transporter 1-like, partial [Priapulus caudatus]|uniref:High-affinity choline transporter 1-like n=1 Tax=Priapulus caudatus TaxID=37621 RepID=A0ABM1F5X7_PRICU
RPQVYFQRVLSARSVGRARALSFIAAAGCIFMSIPPILIGAIGASTDWNATSYGGVVPIPDDDKPLILPIVMQHLTPTWVAFVGLGAVSAAVMSSVDSAFLSGASLFANNIVREIWIAIAGRELPQVALVWTVRGGIVVVGVLAMALGLAVESIYGLWFLCSDLVYVILFPQLLSSLYVPWANTYGSVVAYIVGCILRFVGGEPLIGLPPAVHYPYYNEADGQLFPFRTLAMLASLTGVVAVSALPHYLFTCRKVALKWDVFRCYRQDTARRRTR